MAERKAVNKYYPPDWTPDKGSINKFRGTHALRERARKLHMGILIIRFEMPYNIWCNGCENHIGMGVRYNAEKTKVGMYYTTPIYKFRMKCHLCSNHFEIQTDPQNLDYVILSGARRQERRWDPTQNEQIVPEDKEVSKKLSTDSMFGLEHNVNDEVKSKKIFPSVVRLQEYKELWKEDYLLNKSLRQQFREKKKEINSNEEKDSALLKKASLDISLLPESNEDRKLAGLLKLTPLKSFDEQQKQKREETLQRPIFSEARNDKKPIFSLLKESKRKSLLKPLTKNDLGIIHKDSSESSVKDVDDAGLLNQDERGLKSSVEVHSDCSNSDFKESLISSSTSLVSCDYNSSDSER